MGWENRNGRLYYYRKERVGRQVFSRYVGRGPLADVLAGKDASARRKRKQDRLARQHEREDNARVDTEIDSIGALLNMLTEGALVAAGFHKHKGQWRKNRDGHDKTSEEETRCAGKDTDAA